MLTYSDKDTGEGTVAEDTLEGVALREATVPGSERGQGSWLNLNSFIQGEVGTKKTEESPFHFTLLCIVSIFYKKELFTCD